MTVVALQDAEEEHLFGGKAIQLGAALRAGLPVPPGLALGVNLVEGIANGDRAARSRARGLLTHLGAARVAVRSSAVGEDSAEASFAGQHVTRLNMTSDAEVIEAIVTVWSSGRSESALAYRARLGITAPPRVATVVQAMVDADCAGVLFTRNPVNGSDERVVEATWGLGEAVVSGLGDPDRIRMRRGGEVLDYYIGDKDVAITPSPHGGTQEVSVSATRRRVACLDARRLTLLESLAARCEAVFAGESDIEWAFCADRLYLLQRRAITR